MSGVHPASTVGYTSTAGDWLYGSEGNQDIQLSPAKSPDKKKVQLKDPDRCFPVKVAVESSRLFDKSSSTNYQLCSKKFPSIKFTFESLIRNSRVNTECLANSAAKAYRRQKQMVVPFIWGILVGITITALLFQQHILFSGTINWPPDAGRVVAIDDTLRNSILIGANKSLSSRAVQTTISTRFVHQNLGNSLISSDAPPSSKIEESTKVKTRLYVGVITAEKFLPTRSVAVNNTWGNQADKLEFFAANGTPEEYGVPVVSLEGVSDHEYPPQKKAFRMLQHICTHHINDFEWFVRADDDVYMRVELLKQFLTQIDAEKMIYMGQPGHGVPEVRDRLGLHGHNFCMGGPGVFFNRKTLKALCPHISQCINDVVSGEEDVEIGRCVTAHLHIECTHAWETLKLFYHSYQEEYTEEKPFLGNLAENDHVNKALTLHHIKVPYIMYRVHRHYTSIMVNATVQKMKSQRIDLELSNIRLPMDEQRQLVTSKQIPMANKPSHLREVNTWKSFRTDSIYSIAAGDVTSDITNDVLADLKQIGETGIDEAIGLPQQQFTYSHVSDGYLRSDPVRGTDYLLDVYFSSKSNDVADEIRRVHLVRPLSELEVTHVKRPSVANKGARPPFYVILPLPGSRGSDLDVFVRNEFEPSFFVPEDDRAFLIVVPLGGADKQQSPTINEVSDWYRVKYPQTPITILERSSIQTVEDAYSQGLALIQEQQKPGDLSPLVLFTATNLTLTSNVYSSCLFRTGLSDVTQSDSFYSNYNFVDYKSRRKRSSRPFAQIYQPVPFRIFPLASGTQEPNTGAQIVNEDIGFWDTSSTFGEEGNDVLAPLCGRLNDLALPTVGLRTHENTTSQQKSLKQSIYERIYSGQLTIIRTPDRNFFTKPRR
nr:chondroitin sulfate synthase 1-like [Ciona intestinalis]|eukprot:XP_002131640.1 chondroitin sulfate synthase 1-like [Ciona intestinalis]